METPQNDSNLKSIVDIFLSIMADFSNKLSLLDCEECNSFITKEKMVELLVLLKTHPDLLEHITIIKKRLDILINYITFYRNVSIEGLEECSQKLELSKIKEGESIKFTDKTISNSLTKQQANQGGSVGRGYKATITFFLEKGRTYPHPRPSVSPQKEKRKEKTCDSKKKVSLTIKSHLESLELLNQIMGIVGRVFVDISLAYKNKIKDKREKINKFDDEFFGNLENNISSDLIKIVTTKIKLDESGDIRNTFSPLITQLIEDVEILHCLIKQYNSILLLDVLGLMKNGIFVKKKLEKIKLKYQSQKKYFYERNIYLLMLQIFLDNQEKAALLFETYFQQKKNYIAATISMNERGKNTNFKKKDKPQRSRPLSPKVSTISTIDFFPKINILEDLYKQKETYNPKLLLHKIFQEKINLYYYVILFDKKKFLEQYIPSDAKKSSVKYEESQEDCCINCFPFDIFVFVESNEHYGIPVILHMMNSIKNNQILEEFTNFQMKVAWSLKGKDDGSYKYIGDEMYKPKNEKNILLHYSQVSNYLSVFAKFELKNASDIGVVKDVAKKFEMKLDGSQIFKIVTNIRRQL